MNSQLQSPARTTASNPMGSAPYPAAEEADAIRSQDISESIGNVKKRLRLVFACVGVGAALSIFVSLFLMPRYTAKALLLVSENEMTEAHRADDNAMDTHVALLISRVHLDRVMAEIRNDPDLRDRFARAVDIERHLKVLQEMRSRLIGVNFTAKSPEVAAKVANDIARVYVEQSQSAGDAEAQNLTRQLAQRVDELEGQLTRAESDLRSVGAMPDAEPAASEALRQRIDFLKQQIAETHLRQNLTQRQDEIRKQKQAQSPAIGIYALASSPEQPSSIRPIFIVIPAIIASALFGIALAVIKGRLDPRVHGVDGLRRAFSVPCVGAAPPKPRPQSRFRSRKSPATGSAGKIADAYDRAMEAIAASVFLAPDAGPKAVVMVANVDAAPACDFVFDFAVSASQFKRTLFVNLIESVEDRSKSWTAPKDQQGVMADAARRTQLNGNYISLARDQTSLLALAASGELAETLALLKLDYDWVILAAPPMSQSPVSQVVAGLVDKIVLTVRAGATNYHDVAEALRNLSAFDPGWDFSGFKPRIALVMTDLPSARSKAPTGAPGVEYSRQRSPDRSPPRRSGAAGSDATEPDDKASAEKRNALSAGAIK